MAPEEKEIIYFNFVQNFAFMGNYRDHLAEKVKQAMSAFDMELDYSAVVSLRLSPWSISLLASPNRHRHTCLVPAKQLQKALNPLCLRDGFPFLLPPISLRLFKWKLKSLGKPAEYLQETQSSYLTVGLVVLPFFFFNLV